MFFCYLFYREIRSRLEKQKATRQYIDEFMSKREEVSIKVL